MKHVTSGALWIRLVTGRDKAPVPNFLRGDNHSNDVSGGCLYPLLDVPQLPPQVITSFTTFAGPRQIESTIEVTPLRRATAVLENTWMMGGDSRINEIKDQTHGGTLHWQARADAPINWLKVKAVEALSARVEKHTMHITFSDGKPRPITLQLFLPNVQAADVAAGRWAGLQVKVEPALDASQIQAGSNGTWEVSLLNSQEVRIEIVDAPTPQKRTIDSQ